MVAVLSFHAFVPTPSGVPHHTLFPGQSQNSHRYFYLPLIPLLLGLTGLLIPTQPALFLSLCLHCLILGINWF